MIRKPEKAERIDEFRAAINDHPGLWRSLDIRIIAVEYLGNFYNLACRVYLDGREPASHVALREVPSVDRLCIQQDVRPIEELDVFLASLADGKVTVGGKDILIDAPELNSTSSGYREFYYRFRDPYSSYERNYVQWSSHELTLMSRVTDDSLLGRCKINTYDLDQEIRTDSHPYDGLTGLLKYFVGFDVVESQRDTSVEIFASVEVAFDESKMILENGYLLVSLRAGNVEALKRCRLGLFAFSGTEIPRSTLIEIEAPVTSCEDGFFDQCLRVPCPESNVTLFLQFGKTCVDRIQLSDPSSATANARLAAYQLFDPGLKTLSQGLEGRGRKSRDSAPAFERAVGRVFHTIGFQTDVLGLSEGVDVLAFDFTSRTVLAIECTLGALDAQGKLGKLVLRVAALRNSLPDDFKIIPVIATSSESVADAELLAAGHNKISVLSQDAWPELLNLAASGAGPSQVIPLLLQRVPYAPSERPMFW